MNILVMGKGGREHAIIKALAQANTKHKIFAWPGREGFEPQAKLLFLPEPTKSHFKKLIEAHNIELVIIGPEQELTDGWSDFFRSLGVLVFGPSQRAAKLESSKLFAKSFMNTFHIPTALFKEVHSLNSALKESAHFNYPLVLKADGLAGGKGVFICQNQDELLKASKKLFETKIFGTAGEKAFLEDFQKGHELSVFILVTEDGKASTTDPLNYSLLPFAKDYKKLKDGDKGLNTGGMGAFAPYEVPLTLQKKIEKKIILPTLKGIREKKLFYRGVLYIGLMIVKDEPIVLEYNVRFGDPETQALLPLLDGDWAEVFLSLAKGKGVKLKWKNKLHSVCITLAGDGYPEKTPNSETITGDLSYKTPHSYFLHAGTKKQAKLWRTAGGRVLNSIGLGKSLEQARKNAYGQAKKALWPKQHLRYDIGS